MKVISLIALVCAVCIRSFGQDLATVANSFLSSLDEKSRSIANYPIDDVERFNWHFVPRTRNGIPFKSLTPAQRETALTMLKISLSEQGYGKATSIMENENLLRELEGRPAGDKHRDPLNYYVTIFGTPSAERPWFWRLEGHHLALNFSLNRKEIGSSTPTFWGSNPGTAPSGPQSGRQLLKLESGLGFDLCHSLTDEQRRTAVLSDVAPNEIITGNDRRAKLLTPKGIQYSALNPTQQKLFTQLLEVYVRNYEFDFANRLMAKITAAGIENLSFAWAGSLKPGAGHYYRIQGPMLLIEFDNTQNNANHIHTVVRDLTNDFAEDILKEHYLEDHQK